MGGGGGGGAAALHKNDQKSMRSQALYTRKRFSHTVVQVFLALCRLSSPDPGLRMRSNPVILWFTIRTVKPPYVRLRVTQEIVVRQLQGQVETNRLDRVRFLLSLYIKPAEYSLWRSINEKTVTWLSLSLCLHDTKIDS